MTRAILTMWCAICCVGFAQQLSELKRVGLDREFDLRLGQGALVKIEGVRIGFDSVIEDSRCPKGVDCIWAGQGKIRIKLSKTNKKPASIELSTQQPNNISHLGYRVTLVGLSPYPKAAGTINKKAYVATLAVSKQ
jgi:hypothetical protein